MNLRSMLQQILLTTMITGALLSPNIAEAASSTPVETAPAKSFAEGEPQSGEIDEKDSFVSLITSKKAQKIEFATILGIIGLGIVVPEIFSKSNSKMQEDSQQNQPNAIHSETIYSSEVSSQASADASELFSDPQTNIEVTESNKLQEVEQLSQLNATPLEAVGDSEDTPKSLVDFVERLDIVSAREDKYKGTLPTDIKRVQRQMKPRKRQNRKKRAA